MERDNSLYFLDINIVRTHGHFDMTVYSNWTFGRVFTNYENVIPKSFKFVFICFGLYSNLKHLHQESNNSKLMFRNKCCPIGFTCSCIKKFVDSLYVGKDATSLAPKYNLFW